MPRWYLTSPTHGVAGAARGRRLLALLGLLELAEDLGVRLVHHVRQDVEPTPVRHAKGDHGRADVGGGADDPVQHRDDHVVPFDGEPLLAEERLVEELLEGIYPGEPLEKPLRTLSIRPLVEAARLDGLAQPEPLLGVVDVPEIVPRGVAVDPAQLLGGLPGVGCALGDGSADDERGQGLQILVRYPVEGRIQRRVSRRLAPERVELRGPMPEVPYVPYVLGGPDGLLHVDFGGDLLPVSAGRPHVRRAPGLEKLPHLSVDGIGVLPVVLVEFQHVAEVRPEKLVLRLSLQPDHTLT